MDVFYPNSANDWTLSALTIASANGLPRQLAELLVDLDRPDAKALATTAEAFNPQRRGADELRLLFDGYGSDKGTHHGYHLVYGELLSRLGADRELTLLEIGLGTDNPALVSTMGAGGSPGASVRAFRDFLPRSQILGADVDEATLFRESRIETATVDQLDRVSFARMTEALGCSRFDVIVDDGLHAVDANLNTLRFALEALQPDGWFVVEDIPQRTLPVWQLVGALLSSATRDCYLIECQRAFLFAMNQR